MKDPALRNKVVILPSELATLSSDDQNRLRLLTIPYDEHVVTVVGIKAPIRAGKGYVTDKVKEKLEAKNTSVQTVDTSFPIIDLINRILNRSEMDCLTSIVTTWLTLSGNGHILDLFPDQANYFVKGLPAIIPSSNCVGGLITEENKDSIRESILEPLAKLGIQAFGSAIWAVLAFNYAMSSHCRENESYPDTIFIVGIRTLEDAEYIYRLLHGFILAVAASRETIFMRIKATQLFTDEQINAQIDRNWDNQLARLKANYVVRNDGNHYETVADIDVLVRFMAGYHYNLARPSLVGAHASFA